MTFENSNSDSDSSKNARQSGIPAAGDAQQVIDMSELETTQPYVYLEKLQGASTVDHQRQDQITRPVNKKTVREKLKELVAKKKGRVWTLLAASSAAMAAAGDVAVDVFGDHDEAAPAAVAAVDETPPAPTTIRVNFYAEPEHATVVRADTGETLGTTPLSLELPYGDDIVGFRFQKPGFASKEMHIVPNLSAPLLATLRRAPRPPRSAALATRSLPSPEQVSGRQRQTVRRVEKVDDDGILAPSLR